MGEGIGFNPTHDTSYLQKQLFYNTLYRLSRAMSFNTTPETVLETSLNDLGDLGDIREFDDLIADFSDDMVSISILRGVGGHAPTLAAYDEVRKFELRLRHTRLTRPTCADPCL